MPRTSIPSGTLASKPSPQGAPPPLPAKGAPVRDEVTHPIDLTEVKDVTSERPAGHVSVEARVRAPSRRPHLPDDSDLPPPRPRLEVVESQPAPPRAGPMPIVALGERSSRTPRFAAPPPLLRPDERKAAEAKAKAESEAKAEADAKAKAEADAKAKAESDAKAKAESDAKAKAESDAKAKAESDAKAKAESDAKVKAEWDAKAKAEAEARLVAVAEQRARPPTVTPPGLSSSGRGSIPPASNPGFLIPRPLSSPGVVAAVGPALSDADALRERVAALEVTANAARSIASRLADQVTDASKRSTEHGPRIAELERELAALRDRQARELDEVRARAERPLSLEALEKRVEASVATHEASRTLLQALRVEVDAHTRAFDARKIRIDAIEHELSTLRGDHHLAELRRAIERLDLRMAALEESVSALRVEVATRAVVAAPLGPPREGTPEESRAAVAASAAAPAPTEGVEALGRIKGVGPKTAKALFEAGVRSLADVAGWDDADLVRIAEVLGKKPAQLKKAGWSAAARALLEGETDSGS